MVNVATSGRAVCLFASAIAVVFLTLLPGATAAQNVKNAAAQTRCELKFGPGVVAEEELDFGEVTHVCNCASPYRWNESNTRCVQETSGKSSDSKQPSSASQVPVHACDRLAAHPFDPNRTQRGVPFSQLEKTAREATLACQKAIHKHPGTTRFTFQLGRSLYAKNEFAKALPFIREASTAGYALAIFVQGEMYRLGSGVTKSEKRAFDLFKAAADKGFLPAIYHVGHSYAHGIGTAKSAFDAVHWYRAAATKGYPYAMFQLGIAYHDGRGVPRDSAKAVRWYLKAIENGDEREEVFYNLAILVDAGSGVKHDPKRAARLVVRSLKQSDSYLKNVLSDEVKWSNLFWHELKEILRSEGVYTGEIDGSFGPEVKQAIKRLVARNKS